MSNPNAAGETIPTKNQNVAPINPAPTDGQVIISVQPLYSSQPDLFQSLLTGNQSIQNNPAPLGGQMFQTQLQDPANMRYGLFTAGKIRFAAPIQAPNQDDKLNMEEMEALMDGELSPTASLLIVIGEPFLNDQKELIIQRITKELSSWDHELSGCNLNEELGAVAAKAPIGEDGQHGEKVVQHVSAKLLAEFLINPTHETLTNKLREFLLDEVCSYRHIVYSGQVLQHSGCWILQDSLFTFGNFVKILQGSDICNALINGVLHINTFSEGEWTEEHLTTQLSSYGVQVYLNPPPRQAVAESTDLNHLIQFGDYLSHFLKVVPLKDLLQSSDVVRHVCFNRPTLCIFPSCQGDSAFFEIGCFKLLVNGGYGRKACFWDFIRHLDRIDAMLITHLGADNLFGIGAMAAREVPENVHPKVGIVYMNAFDEGKTTPKAAGGGDSEGRRRSKSLLVNLSDQATAMVEDLKAAWKCQLHACVGVMQDANLVPINLYHNVGHGTLDMYVMNPMQNSEALTEFLLQWSEQSDGFTAKSSEAIPACHAASVCGLLVWKPASLDGAVTRVLFPGSATQGLLFEGLDNLKNVNLFQHRRPFHMENDNSGGRDTACKGSSAKTQPPKQVSEEIPPSTCPGKSDVKKESSTKADENAAGNGKTAENPVVPFYVDLAYVPCHGNRSYVNIDFFRRVRARYYVLSTISPDAEILTALLQAKEMWNEPELEATIITTYETNVLNYWKAANEDQLSQLKIDVAPSANRFRIYLPDRETSFAAYPVVF